MSQTEHVLAHLRAGGTLTPAEREVFEMACRAFEEEMWPDGPAHGSGSGIWAAHKPRIAAAAGWAWTVLDVRRLARAMIAADPRYSDGSGDGPGLDGCIFEDRKADRWAKVIAAEYARLRDSQPEPDVAPRKETPFPPKTGPEHHQLAHPVPDLDLERLQGAAVAAYEAMDAATKWAAHQRPERDTLEAVDEHIAGYDALLDGQVRLGRALGILSDL